MMKKYSLIILSVLLSLGLMTQSAFAQSDVRADQNQTNRVEILNSLPAILTGGSAVTFTFEESDGYFPGFLGGQQDWLVEGTSYAGYDGPEYNPSVSPVVTPDGGATVGDWSLGFPKDPGFENDVITLATSPSFDPVAGEGYQSVKFNWKITEAEGADYRFYIIDTDAEFIIGQIVFDWQGRIFVIDYTDPELAGNLVGNWEPSNDFQEAEIRFTPFADTEYYVNGEFLAAYDSSFDGENITAVRMFADNWHISDPGFFDNIRVTREIMDEEVELGDFGLLSPSDNAEFTVNEGSDDEIVIEWEVSENAETYTWLANVPNAGFEEPLLSLASDNGGTANTLTLTEGAIYDILTSFGFESGNVITLDWTVIAAAGETTLQSEDVFNIAGITMQGVTSTEPIETVDGFALAQNYPNPFNPTTNISFSIPETSEVTLEVYNMQGQRVATIANGTMAAGSHNVSFDAANLSSGIYLYRLTAGALTATNKMMLIK